MDTLERTSIQEKRLSVLVYSPTVAVQSSASIEKDLIWYDSFYQRLEKFRASTLKYSYVEEEFIEVNGGKIPKKEASKEQLSANKVKKAKRLKAIPETCSIKITSKKTDKEKVSKWYETYINYNETDSTLYAESSEGKVFIVGERELDNFLYDLDMNNFGYKVLD